MGRAEDGDLDFTCYVHVPGAITPHVRFYPDMQQDELGSIIAELKIEWPHYERIEIYGENDRPILKLDRSGHTQKSFS